METDTTVDITVGVQLPLSAKDRDLVRHIQAENVRNGRRLLSEEEILRAGLEQGLVEDGGRVLHEGLESRLQFVLDGLELYPSAG